ncbi:MAG: hypothetical protein CMK59_15500 [Proteobacteria bacterium]|nr:hypothetical protein [Pseudomonadota bacterium]
MSDVVFIDDFADALLSASTLKEKCFAPERIVLRKHTPLRTKIHLPNRPPELRFTSKNTCFPQHFSSPQARGKAFHFFANHELLAIELMALNLLRFPQAPDRFKRGLLHIIKEEQEHLKLYVEGAEKLGVALGSLPVNRFFWDMLSDCTSSYEFIVGMGLTFEQANLDFSLKYMHLFRQEGDHQSADILEQVYEDEIRHVKHALHWFHQWKNPDLSDWDNHQQTLRYPLTPARAKGDYFCTQARQKCGFTEDYVSKLKAYRHSKGRRPSLYWFNIGHEFDLQHNGSKLPKAVKMRETWFAPLMMLLCKENDLVMVDQHLPVQQLLKLSELGFPLPEFITPKDLTAAKHRKINRFHPWGWSYRSKELLQKLGERITHTPHILELNQQRKLASKALCAQLLQEFLNKHPLPQCHTANTAGRVCSTWSEIVQAFRDFQIQGWSEMMMKANLSSAGRGNVILSNLKDPKIQSWAKRQFKNGPVVVEPRFTNGIDCSAQLWIEQDSYSFKGLSFFKTTPKGDYLGHLIKSANILPKGIQRPLYENDALKKLCSWIGPRMSQAGYTGPLGIDMLLYEHKEQLFWRPIIELNPRYTMGMFALSLKKYIAATGVLTFLTQEGLQKHQQPPTIKQQSNKIQILDGMIALTDTVHPVVACLLVGQTALDFLDHS